MGSTNTTTVKYIRLHVPTDGNYHDLTYYELLKTSIEHSTYDELHFSVSASCPKGYTCIEPLALYHEVTWSTNGEQDVLHHAIEEQEYGELWGTCAGPKTICVDVERFNF